MHRALVVLVCLATPMLGGSLALPRMPPVQKVCSGVEPFKWRFVIPVPSGWQIADCRSYVKDIRAKEMTLGCLFEEAQPNGAKFSWGPPVVAAREQREAVAPNPNCGW